MATLGTFTTGQVLTAAELNAIGTYTAFTPTWTNLTLGNGVATFRYVQINKLVHYYGQLQLGSTTSVTGSVRLSLPVTAKSASVAFHAGIGYEDSGSQLIPGYGYFQSTTSLELIAINVAGTYPAQATISATIPFTWAVNDRINVNITYEAA
jgi:hypothetical protein